MTEVKTESIVLQLVGLSCSCETKVVEKRMKALKGVESFEVNPISYKMKVTYDPAQATLDDIQKAVAKAGAKAEPIPKHK